MFDEAAGEEIYRRVVALGVPPAIIVVVDQLRLRQIALGQPEDLFDVVGRVGRWIVAGKGIAALRFVDAVPNENVFAVAVGDFGDALFEEAIMTMRLFGAQDGKKRCQQRDGPFGVMP